MCKVDKHHAMHAVRRQRYVASSSNITDDVNLNDCSTRFMLNFLLGNCLWMRHVLNTKPIGLYHVYRADFVSGSEVIYARPTSKSTPL